MTLVHFFFKQNEQVIKFDINGCLDGYWSQQDAASQIILLLQ